MPVFFERMRAPYVVALRTVEGLVTGLLYRSQRVELRLAPPGVSAMAYALLWTLGCASISAMLDANCRRRLAAARRDATGVRGADPLRGGGAAGGCDGDAAAAPWPRAPGGQVLCRGGGVVVPGGPLKGKKVD